MFLFKKAVIALSINIALVSSALACTTLLAGSEATNDGSLIVARSADSDALKAQHFVIHPAKSNQTDIYSTQAHHGANNFTYPLPKHSLRYTTVPNWKTQLHGATGFNELGVGVSGTESIFASPKALAFDPYVEDTEIFYSQGQKLPVKQLNYWGTSSKHKVREKGLGLPSLIKMRCGT